MGNFFSFYSQLNDLTKRITLLENENKNLLENLNIINYPLKPEISSVTIVNTASRSIIIICGKNFMFPNVFPIIMYNDGGIEKKFDISSHPLSVDEQKNTPTYMKFQFRENIPLTKENYISVTISNIDLTLTTTFYKK